MSATTSTGSTILKNAGDQGKKVLEVGHRWGTSVRSLLEGRLSQLMHQPRPGGDALNNSSSDNNDDTDFDCATLPPSPAVLENSPGVPLSIVPEDCCVSLLGYLTAEDLCAVRATSWGLQQSADLHADELWSALCRHDFPNVILPSPSGGRQDLLPHQRYIKNVMQRAVEEAGNIRATQRARESLQTYATKHGGGIIGLVSDLGYIPDQRIARSVSYKRRAAMSSAVVASERVVYDFRCRGLYLGPLNFLPIRTLLLEHPGVGGTRPWARGVVGGGTAVAPGADALLPLAPESPAPEGFLGYVVRLVRLRPEHEPLRWTVLFAVFKDMVVFECEAHAEAVRARMPNQRLFYCALDHPGAQDDPCPSGGVPLPHIGHWGFRPLLVNGGGGAFLGGEGLELEMVPVEERAGSLERTACYARSSLAFLQYGGSGRRTERGGESGRAKHAGVVDEKEQQAIGTVIHVFYQ